MDSLPCTSQTGPSLGALTRDVTGASGVGKTGTYWTGKSSNGRNMY